MVTNMTSQAPITLSPCEAVLLFEVCVDSTLTRGRDSGGGAPHSDVYRNSILVTKFIERTSIHGPIAAFLTQGSQPLEGIRALAKSIA